MADGRVEIQLGHMCNNRCVFCVSGQRTERREAFPLPGDPVFASIRELKEAGGRQLTFLGGEPTLQPAFLQSVRYAAELGFEEIVVHTNGVKTARASFVDEVLAQGGNLSFRLSFQGATREAHERTTQKPGSFDRLVQSMRNIRARGKRLSVNMCVVQSNYASVEAFPELLLPYGVWQLHLDMMRPLDAGERSEEELRALIPRYPLMRPHLVRMVEGFPEGFDVNIGNLPYCIAPELAHVIRHDGATTLTVAVDDADTLSNPWDKYENKKRDKVKHAKCAECVFDSMCTGFYETYRDFYGDGDFVPVTRERLLEIDPERRLFTLHFRRTLDHLVEWTPPSPFQKARLALDTRDETATLVFDAPGGDRLAVRFTRPGEGVGATDAFALQLLETPDTGERALRLLRAVFDEARRHSASRIVHPPGDDAPFYGAGVRGPARLVDRRLVGWLRALRRHAPFGELEWKGVTLGPREATLLFTGPLGEQTRVTMSIRGERLNARYELLNGAPTPALREGLGALFDILRGDGR